VADGQITDLTIIGGGPTGLFAAFYAGLRELSCCIIDSLPELGGQLTALYPEKYIYDVGGLPRILARDLARNLAEQGTRWGAEVRLEEDVRTLTRAGDVWELTTNRGTIRTRTLLIAAGKGAFAPRSLDVPGYERLMGRGVSYHVRDPVLYQELRILIVGGGDSAVDWVLNLKERSRRLILIHRREGFRAHPQSMKQLRDAVAEGVVELLTHREVREIHGEERVTAVTLFDNRSGQEDTFEVDAVLALIGFKPDLGPIASWGLELEKNAIRVNARLETNLPGVYAAGDIASYEGKIELIATGFSEAAMAVNHAAQRINPAARYNPGHSTNLKIFKEQEEVE
jgi:thioredoxin reductase (NADPH)